MDTSTLAIEVNGISKSYGTVKALDHVSLEVQRGEIFGLIGPDGAGKTTLSKLIMTKFHNQILVYSRTQKSSFDTKLLHSRVLRNSKALQSIFYP